MLGVFELLKDNYEQAAACSQRAIELNPSDAYIKARSASVSTYLGEPEPSLQLLDKAESLDPFLPVWCIEERGVALYALERFRDAIQALGNLMFQTYCARLYRLNAGSFATLAAMLRAFSCDSRFMTVRRLSLLGSGSKYM